MTTAQQENIDNLNSFLRGEMSAVETYRQAIEALPKSSHAIELAECQQSHEERVRMLAEQILALGGQPAESSGAWGAFAKVVEGGAAILGEKVAIAALEQGEDHGDRTYASDLPKLDGRLRALIEASVLPLQRSTHAAMRALKERLV